MSALLISENKKLGKRPSSASGLVKSTTSQSREREYDGIREYRERKKVMYM